MGVNGLTSSLNQFIAVFNAGYDRLAPYALGLLVTLIVIDVALTGAYTALGKHNASSLLERILFLGAWTWVTTSFPTLAKAFRDSLISAGLIAGGRGGDHTLLSDPSRIASMGFDLTAPILALAEKSGVLDGGDMLFYWFCYCLLMLCFLLMALQVYLAVIEFYLRVTISCILLPFGVFNPTRFIGEKPIGAIVSSGIKLMVLAFVLSVGEPILANHIRFGSEDPGFNALWAALLSSGGMLLLTWMAPSIATGFMNGSPALSAGAAASAAVTGATMAAGGAAATVAATRLAASAVGAVGKAGAHMAGSAAAGAKMGAAAGALSGGPAGAVLGGVGGAAKGAGGAVVDAVAGAVRRVAGGAVDGPRAAFARGGEAFKGRGAQKQAEPLSGPASEKEWSAAAGGYTKPAAAPVKLSSAQVIRVGDGGEGPLIEMAPAGGFRGGSGSPPPAAADADEEAAAPGRAPSSSSPPSAPPSAPPPAPPPPAAEPVPPPIWADKTREHLLRLAAEPRHRPQA